MNPEISARINELRAVAALWVFVFHYEHFITHSFFKPVYTLNPIHILVYNGYAGVSLFFCLSGFLFAHNYCLKPRLNIGSYYVKRLLRILPGFALFILFFFIFFNADNTSLIKLLTSVFYLNVGIYPKTIGHLWSINRELQCYALFPLLWLAHRYSGIKTPAIIALLSLSSIIVWALINKPIILYFYGSFNLRFFEFIAGMIAGINYNKCNSDSNRSKLLFFVLIYISLLSLYHFFSWKNPLVYSPFSIIWLCINSVFCLLFIVLYLQYPLILPKNMLFYALEKMGEASYSFYLYHFLIIGFFANHRNLLSNSHVLNFIIILTVSLGTALIAYQLIEKPALNLKRQLFPIKRER